MFLSRWYTGDDGGVTKEGQPFLVVLVYKIEEYIEFGG
jgi:hypothetical protein